MTPENFCYWLQGLLEVGQPDTLIQDHLTLVFTKLTPNKNDNLVILEEDIKIIQELAQNYSHSFKFNIVRYNTHDPLKYKETAKLKEIQQLFSLLNLSYKLIERVGTDVQASCGMFYK